MYYVCNVSLKFFPENACSASKLTIYLFQVRVVSIPVTTSVCTGEGPVTLRTVRFVLMEQLGGQVPALSPSWGAGGGPWQPSDFVTCQRFMICSMMQWQEQGVLKLDLD